MFVDESGETTEMTRRYGRARRGQRVREATPAGHWSTLTLLGAMSEEGLLATMIVESPTDGDALGAYLGQVLRSQLPAQKLIEPFASSSPKALLLRFCLTRNCTAYQQAMLTQ